MSRGGAWRERAGVSQASRVVTSAPLRVPVRLRSGHGASFSAGARAQPGPTVGRGRCSSSGRQAAPRPGLNAFLLCRAVPPGRCAPRGERMMKATGLHNPFPVRPDDPDGRPAITRSGGDPECSPANGSENQPTTDPLPSGLAGSSHRSRQLRVEREQVAQAELLHAAAAVGHDVVAELEHA